MTLHRGLPGKITFHVLTAIIIDLQKQASDPSGLAVQLWLKSSIAPPEIATATAGSGTIRRDSSSTGAPLAYISTAG